MTRIIPKPIAVTAETAANQQKIKEEASTASSISKAAVKPLLDPFHRKKVDQYHTGQNQVE